MIEGIERMEVTLSNREGTSEITAAASDEAGYAVVIDIRDEDVEAGCYLTENEARLLVAALLSQLS